MKTCRLFSFWVLTLIILFIPGILLAQTGKITGKVIDAETGEPLIGASVLIQGTTQGASTDKNGRYTILNVSPGEVTLIARYIGYQTKVVKDLRVRTNLTTTQNFELNPQTVEGERVVVTAEREMVIKDQTSTIERVNQEEIENLPVQEFTDILQLQAGVNVDDQGQIHIRGGRTSEISYVVDGVRMTDDYNRSLSISLENQMIKEMSIIQGTFNAEYGRAMSGVVNVVTRSGGNEFKGSLKSWAGSYMATTQPQLYSGITNSFSEFSPQRQQNISVTFSGPIIKDRLTFFSSFRSFQNKGWLTGRNAYSPHGPYQDTVSMDTDLSNYRTLYGERVDPSQPWYSIDTTVIQGRRRMIIRDNGRRDSSIVNMNPFRTRSGMLHLEYNPDGPLRFNLIGNYGHEEGQNYWHQKKLVPRAVPTFYRDNYSLNLKTTYTPVPNTFLTVNTAYKFNEYKSYLYESPYDPRYFNYQNINRFGGVNPGQQFQFDHLGTDNSRFFRSTTSFIAKADIRSQVNNHHLVEGGINFQADIVSYNNYTLQPLSDAQGITLPEDIPKKQRQFIELGIPPVDNPSHSKYTRKPFNLSAYIQDKIEYENLIVNAGLRLDYFDPNAPIPADPKDPDITNPLLPKHRQMSMQERQKIWWEEANPKWQISPRLGVAYPIPNAGVVHFSYGYFFQMPTYQYLYNNSQILIEQSSGVYGIFGNPDLEPQRTVQYELGYKQEIFKGTAVKVTGFYKDTRNYVSSGPINQTYIPSVRYATWVNRDFSLSRGVTIGLKQMINPQVRLTLDYTFNLTEGSNSDPAAEFQQVISQGGTAESLAKFVRPLDWNRLHIANATFYYSGKNWGFNVVSQYKTGTPYTPSTPFRVRHGPTASNQNLQNTARLPAQFIIDMSAHKNVDLFGHQLQFFANIYNLLDSPIVQNVYSDSGEPDRPLIIPGEFDPGYLENPAWYGEPRRIQLGIQYSF